jgi:AcrR family transcriptional regulator
MYRLLCIQLNIVKIGGMMMSMRALKPHEPRANYHHGNLEMALIGAATAMIRESGVEHISLRAVAAQVGVSPSAAYHYFPDKDALIGGVGQALFDLLADRQERAVAEFPGTSAKAARARFRALGRAYFEWGHTETNLFRLMFGVFCSLDERQTLTARDESRAWKLLQQSLDDLAESGAINPALRPYGEILAWSAVHGATSLIVEGHLPADAFESVLDAIELSLGVMK